MKRITLSIIVATLLAGCSSLNVSWSLNASYNTNQRTMTETTHLTSPGNEPQK